MSVCRFIRHQAVNSVILLAILSIGSSLAQADGFSAGLTTRIDWWPVAKVEFSYWGWPEETFSGDDLETGTTDMGMMFGPEIAYSRGRLSINGTFLFSGERNFDVTLRADRTEPIMEPTETSGRAKRTWSAIDIRYGRGYALLVGYRRLNVTVSDWTTGQFRSHAIGGMVIGFSAGGPIRSENSRWSLRLNAAVGGAALLHLFSHEKQVEHSFLGDASLDVGYRLLTLPLRVKLGYGVMVAGRLDRNYMYTSPVVPIPDERWETFKDIEHGIRLTVLWDQ